MTIRAVGTLGLVSLVLLVSPGFAASTSPGKSSAYESSNGNVLSTSDATLLTATIAMGRSKSVVEVTATVHYDVGVVTTEPTLTVTVNGVTAQPTTGGFYTNINQRCSAACTVSGNWWLDLDAAEAANPGMFVGKTLSVHLIGREGLGGGGETYMATLAARMQKK